MRTYELMTIFPLEEDQFKSGIEGVRNVLTESGVEIVKEEGFGDRDLSYEVKKVRRGRFILFVLKASPSKIIEIDRHFKLNQQLLKFMFVRIDE